MFRRFGFDVVRYPVAKTLHGHLSLVFKELGVNLVLDVGANEGQFAQGLRKHAGYSGRIVSFEPFRGAQQILKGACDRNRNWTFEPYALGSINHNAELLTFPGSDWNSFSVPHHENLEIFG